METEQTTELTELLKMGEPARRYFGNDNSGKPKTEYLSRLISMDDDKLLEETKSKIWLSAFAANNHRSDYHWHCDACYDECQRRNRPEIYTSAYQYHAKEF